MQVCLEGIEFHRERCGFTRQCCDLVLNCELQIYAAMRQLFSDQIFIFIVQPPDRSTIILHWGLCIKHSSVDWISFENKPLTMAHFPLMQQMTQFYEINCTGKEELCVQDQVFYSGKRLDTIC